MEIINEQGVRPELLFGPREGSTGREKSRREELLQFGVGGAEEIHEHGGDDTLVSNGTEAVPLVIRKRYRDRKDKDRQV